MQIAIITGASSGLGAAFARAITTAYSDLDEIWLIARRRERLEEFAATHQGRTFRILALDLTEAASFAELERTLRESCPQVRILVNNAGDQSMGRLEDVPIADMDRMLEVNVMAATRLQRLCTPYLVVDSMTVLTASVLAYVPTAGQAVYSASKAYLYSLGRALREEYRGRQGNVLVLCPGSMDTEMNPKERNPHSLYYNVDRIAETALRKAERGAAVYTPGIPYKAYRVITRILPQALLIRIVAVTYRK